MMKVKTFTVIEAIALSALCLLSCCRPSSGEEHRWGEISQDKDMMYIRVLNHQPYIFIPVSGNSLLGAVLEDGSEVSFEQTKNGVLLHIPSTLRPDATISLEFEHRIGSGKNTSSGDYLAFLYDNMPLPDMMTKDLAFWEANVDKAVEVREKMGWDIPEREFRHFVLPLRVNNETLDDFRTEYADSLCRRIAGMNLEEAALELNHWCHEMATYHPSDGRTSSPMATIRSGLGRCGEESVLAVAAFRAAGIPARQVYTPRWAHTDDNHAWVEVWVDGKWHFLGACEPEPVLDRAWFNGPVSRALLLHTNAFGDYQGDEDVISSTTTYTEINVIQGYVPTRKSVVRVLDENGDIVPGADIEYKIYNYAELYTVARYRTGDDGTVSLSTGLGDMPVWASKGDRFGISVANSENVDIILNHHFGEEFSMDVDIVPPMENALPSEITAEQETENKRRFVEEDFLREKRPKGNDDVLTAFACKWNNQAGNAVALRASLSEKDMNDVTAEVLDDAMKHCDGEFDKYRDCPRIELEFLHPFFEEIGEGLQFENPAQISEWVSSNIAPGDRINPNKLRIPPVFVWRERVADKLSRDIFFVALCRAKGFSARIDEVTGKAQYLENSVWIDIESGAQAPRGSLTLAYEPNGIIQDPQYYSHFSISCISDGTQHLLSLPEDDAPTCNSLFSSPFSVDEGYYSLTSGSRMSDGSVLAHISFFNVKEGENTRVPLVLRKSGEKLNVLGHMDTSPLLPLTGREFFIMAFMGDKDEPTVHARKDLESIAQDLNDWGRKTVIICDGSIETGIDGINGIERYEDKDGALMKMLLDGCDTSFSRLPVVAVADSFGNVVYLSQGYNTSLAEDLRRVISNL